MSLPRKRKRENSNINQDKVSNINQDNVSNINRDKVLESPSSDYMQDVSAFIVLAGIGKARKDIFSKQLRANGGEVNDSFSLAKTSHVIIDDNMDAGRLLGIMKWEAPPECKIVKSLWLSHCLRDKTKLDTSSYELDVQLYIDKKKTMFAKPKTDENDANQAKGESICFAEQDAANEVKKLVPKSGIMFSAFRKHLSGSEEEVDSDYHASGDEDHEHTEDEQTDIPTTSRILPKGNWVSSRSSLAPKQNHNKHITDKLEALARTYENTNDKWRALGYAKAITMLKAHHKEITTFEEAKALPGVGSKLAEKIWEIIESGELRKLNELSSSEEIKAINIFTDIWGVGATTARSWVAQGFRTLEDVRGKANLTRHQKIGMKYYDELKDRMSREEAGEIEQTVKDAAHAIDPGLICMACGSYRRGKATCGDVDVLVTHPDGRSHKGVFTRLLDALRQSGFITDDLVTSEESGNQKKYLGVCLLPGDGRYHRRLDIIVVPYDEYACAIMYFTGSAHFNRSMRNLAGKMGMSLNEHGLFAGVVRKGSEKITKGFPLKTPDEASVFKHLGLTYRSPNERDH